ncbi:hypothetical protein [Legionella londiniensis]|uniref:Uncharacterized protein n=1 Tax=Legionella londiniensis TaxID=45068 RepID=A0A0W0VJR5_9GAMM|nr:hypothetical protein [Legionella londiniensis]KTD20351.1 hypothetical protein Llon_1704 [Legionella londiniensis]STX93954.1 Uncharacterised protein [Legionella londiniensis]
MINKIAKMAAIALASSVLTAHAEESCFIEVAVASPPVELYENVAFNASNDIGVNRSVTLSGGSAPYVIDKLPCVDNPYVISATRYGILNGGAIGECELRAGAVRLSHPGSSVSVVFPNDFICLLKK